MRKLLLLLFPFLLAACSDDDNADSVSFTYAISDAPVDTEISINKTECGISTTGDAQSIVVTIVGEYDSFSVDNNIPEWLTIKKSKNSLKLNLPEYIGDEYDMRSCAVNVSVAKGSLRATGRIILHQWANEEEVYPVYLSIDTAADWQEYGVHIPSSSYRYFCIEKNLPSTFAYTPESATGLGGVLLVCDNNGNVVAYDAACPIEHSASTVIFMDADTHDAHCNKCNSNFDIFGTGKPTSGKALRENRSLTRYTITPNSKGGYVVTN